MPKVYSQKTKDLAKWVKHESKVCFHAYKGFEIRYDHRVRPCCWYKEDWRDLYDNFENPQEYIGSDFQKDIQAKLDKGEWPKGCKDVCGKTESKGLLSRRQKDTVGYIKRLEKTPETKEELYENLRNSDDMFLDMRLKTLCNSSCITCSPYLSSKIEEETEKHQADTMDHYLQGLRNVKDAEKKHREYGFKFKTGMTDEYFEKLWSIRGKSGIIRATGGEPSLNKSLFNLYEEILRTNGPDSHSIEFNSNFQAFNQKWIKMISRFNNGRMSISVDGFAERNDFLRYGSEWATVEKNIKQWLKMAPPGWHSTISPTVSILNLWQLPVLEQWATSLGVKVSYINILRFPEVFSVASMDTRMKESVLEHLTRWYELKRDNSNLFNEYQVKNLISYVKNYEGATDGHMGKYMKKNNIKNPFEMFVEQMQKISKLRYQDENYWLEVMPEYRSYV